MRLVGSLLLGVSSIALLASGVLNSARAQSSIALDPITVVATKTPETTTQALAAVSSIRQEQIQQFMPGRLSTIFSGMPGVWFQERGDDQGTAINIRGLQDFGRIAVLIDGARQNFQRTGHNADGLFYFEPELLAAADVVRGPVSNIYGSGAIGGVVSMRTKDVDDILAPGQNFGIATHGMLGTNTARGLTSAFAAARINPNVDAFIGGTYRKHADYNAGGDVPVLNSGYETHTGIGKLTFRPLTGHEIKFSGTTYETNFFNGTPNATGTATVYDTRVQNDIASARWKYSRPEDRLFNFDGNFYFTRTDSSQVKTQGTNSAISGLLGSRRTFTIETVGTDVNNTSRFDTGPVRHTLTYGGDWFRDQVNVTDPTGTGDLFTPNGERSVGGGFVQLKSQYTAWLESIVAARYDTFSLNGAGTSSSGDRISPKATLGVTPISWFTIYGTYAEGYRAPAITEVFVTGQHPFAGPGSNFIFLSNSSLMPEVGKTIEGGINIRQDNLATAGDALRIKANVYRNNVDDFIELTQVPFGSFGVGDTLCPVPIAGCLQYQNIEGARIHGTEFEGAYDAGQYFLTLAHSTTKGTNVANNNPLLKIPPQKVVGTVGGRFLDRRITSLVRWTWVDAKDQSEIPPGTTAILPTSAYNLVDFYASFAPNPDVLWEFAVDNIFDKNYARYLDMTTVGATAIRSLSPGRTVKAGIRVLFGEAFYKAILTPAKS